MRARKRAQQGGPRPARAVPEDGAVALGEVSELDMGLDMRYASIQ